MSVADFTPPVPTVNVHITPQNIDEPMFKEKDTAILIAPAVGSVPKDPAAPAFLDLNFPDSTGHLGV